MEDHRQFIVCISVELSFGVLIDELNRNLIVSGLPEKDFEVNESCLPQAPELSLNSA